MRVPRRLAQLGLCMVLSAGLIATVGCVGNGRSSTPVPPSGGATAAPAGLAYSASPVIYIKGSAITANVPTSTGGAITSYSVAPTLPAGLVLNQASGQITGVPTSPVPAATYTILGSNGLGSATCLLLITVNDSAPTNLTYPSASWTLSRGVAVIAQAPANGGGIATGYAVEPALPAGLALNTTTGVITGTPTAASVVAPYTITASNSSGSATCQLSILVKDLPPTLLAYPSPVLSFYLGVPIAAQVPVNSGGLVAAYTVSPALPAGLSLNGTTGVLSGTPTSVQAAADYVITGTNSGGSATTQLSISVNLVPPTILVQPQTQTVQPPDAVTFTVTAQANGGGALSYVWKKNGTAIPGETAAAYTVPSTEFATNTDDYSVTVSEGGLSVVSASVYAIAAVPSPTYAGDPVPVPSRPVTILPSLHMDAVKFPNGAFRLGYDEALKNPVWTSYVNFPVKAPYANSSADYTTDLRLAAPQVGKDDYTGIYTGGANYPDSYDRGHQVPRADVSYRYTPVAGDDATIMSNLVPQISQFNQQTWQKLEDAIGGTQGGSTDGLTSFKGRVWVYTGSVFPASPVWWNSTLTAGLKIAIPVACYKIVVHEVTPGHPEVLAMLMPNAWGLPNAVSTLTSYVTSVARIEALTGLDFFPNLGTVAPTVNIPTWKATVDVRGWRTPFEQATGPNVHMLQPGYDATIEVGSSIDFEGAATPNNAAAAGTTIASSVWNFGDASPTSMGFTTTHSYTSTGTFNASFSAGDSLGTSNVITRVIRVIPPASSNAGPVTTPTVLAGQSTTVGQAITVTFTVSDDRTSPGAVTVIATSDNTTLLPSSGISLSNSAGTVTLVLTPAASQIGTANLTVTLTDGDGAVSTRIFVLTVSAPIGNTLTEGFETGTKTSYVLGNVNFASGSWALSDALIGTSATDRKTGLQSLRIRNGKATMNFDYPNGAQTVTMNHAKYGADANSTWALFYSTDGGTSWLSAGAPVVSSVITLTPATFTVNVTGPIRFEIRKTDGLTTRFNLDDFQINGY